MTAATKIDSFMQQQLMMTKKSKACIIQQQSTVYCRQLFVGTYTAANCSNFPTKLDSDIEFRQQLEKTNPKVLTETFKFETQLGNVFILNNVKKEMPPQPLMPKPKQLPLKTLVVALFAELQLFIAVAFEPSKIQIDYHSVIKTMSQQLLETGIFVPPVQAAPASQNLQVGYNAFSQTKVIMFQGVKMPFVQQPIVRQPRQQLTCLVFVDSMIQDLESVIQKIYFYQQTYPFVYYIVAFKNLPKQKILKRVQAAKYAQFLNIVDDAACILPDLLFTAISFQFFDDSDNETGFAGENINEIQQYCDAILEINRRDYENAMQEQDERMRNIQSYQELMNTCHDAEQMDNYKMQIILLQQEMINLLPQQEFEDTFPEKCACAEEQDMIVEPSYVTMMGIRMTLVKPDLKGSIDTEVQFKKDFSQPEPEILSADELRRLKCPSIASKEREALPYVVAFLRDTRVKRDDSFDYLHEFVETLNPMKKDQSSSNPDKIFDKANLIVCCENLYQTDMGRFELDDKKDPSYQQKQTKLSQIKIWLQRSHRMVDDYGVFSKLNVLCGDKIRNIFFIVVDGMVQQCVFTPDAALQAVGTISEEINKREEAEALEDQIQCSIYREEIEELANMQLFMKGDDIQSIQLIINELAKADQEVYQYQQFDLSNFLILVQTHFPHDQAAPVDDLVRAFVASRQETSKQTRIQKEKADIKLLIQELQNRQDERLNAVLQELVPSQAADFQTVDEGELLNMICKFIDSANSWDNQLQLIDTNFADPEELNGLDKNDVLIRLHSMVEQVGEVHKLRQQKNKKPAQAADSQSIGVSYTHQNYIKQIRQFNCVSLELREAIDAFVKLLIDEKDSTQINETTALRQTVQVACDNEVQLINQGGEKLTAFENQTFEEFLRDLQTIQNVLPFKIDQIGTVAPNLAEASLNYLRAGGVMRTPLIIPFLIAVEKLLSENKDKIQSLKSEELKENLQGYKNDSGLIETITGDSSLVVRILNDIYEFLEIPKPVIKKDEFPDDILVYSAGGSVVDYSEFVSQLKRNCHVGSVLQELIQDLVKVLEEHKQDPLSLKETEAEMAKFQKPLYQEIELINKYVRNPIAQPKVFKLYDLLTVLQAIQDFIPFNYELLTKKETSDALMKFNIDLGRVMDQVKIYMDLKDNREKENQKLKVTAELQLQDQHIKNKVRSKTPEQERACADIFRFQPLNSDYTLDNLLFDLAVALDLSKIEVNRPAGGKMVTSTTDPDALAEKTLQYQIIKNCINLIIGSRYVQSVKNDAVYGLNLFWKYIQFGDADQQEQVRDRTIRLILHVYEDIQKNFIHQSAGNLGGSQSLTSSLVGTVTLNLNTDINNDYTMLLERFEGDKAEDFDADDEDAVVQPLQVEDVFQELVKLTRTLQKMK